MFDKRAFVADAFNRALSMGVNPYRALGIVSREGLVDRVVNSPTFGNRDAKGYSFGPWQLYSGNPDPSRIAGGGMASEFVRRYGEAPNSNNWQKQNEFALNLLKQQGDKAANTWYAVRDNGGWGNIEKIGQQVAQKYGLSSGGPPMMAYADPKSPSPAMNPGIAAIQNKFGGPSETQAPMQTAMGGQQMPPEQPEDTNPLSALFADHRLARAGAALMAIDNPQGASALMSGLKDDAKKTNNWQTDIDPKTGRVIRVNRETGQVDMSPIPGWTPPAQDPTTQQRNFDMWKNMPEGTEKKALGKMLGIEEDTTADPESLKMFGTDFLINGNPAALKDVPIKQRDEAVRLAREEYEKNTGTKFDPTDLALRRGEYQQFITEQRKFGAMLSPTQTAHERLQADIKIAKERLNDLPAKLNASNLPFNRFMQMKEQQLQDAGYPELAKAREALYSVERGYSSVQANGMRSGDTVYAQKRAADLINTAMSPDVLLGRVGQDGKRSGGLLDFMGESSTRIVNGMKSGQDRLRQQWKKGAKTFAGTYDDIAKAEDEEINKRLDAITNPPAQTQQAPAQAAPAQPKAPLSAEERTKIIEELRRRGRKM